MTEAKRGVRNGSTWIAAASPRPSSGTPPYYAASQQWTLDFLGNHKSADTDLDADGTYESAVAGELIEGEHNLANELLERTVIASPNVELPFNYDKAGNMEEKAPGPHSSRFVYTYDAWNRLVKVEYKNSPTSSPVTRTELKYNAVHQITQKLADSGDAPDGTLDQKRTRYYNAQWQLLLEKIDDNYNSSAGVNRDMLYVWGIRGMDDITVRIQNRNFSNDSPNVTYDDFWYHLTDTQFSTIAIIDRVGKLLERISYTAGGEARHHHRADLNGDGGTSSGELFTISTLAAAGGGAGTGITSSSYNPNADIDCDGTIDSADYGLVSGLGAQAALRRGQISGAWVASSGSNAPSSTDNIVGYCGYLFNAECGLYSVRFRVYDPVLQRFIQRDPAGAIGGINLYEYVRGNPLRYCDPLGLWPQWLDDLGSDLVDGAGALYDLVTGNWEEDDKEWGEMMEDNQELLKEKLADQRERGVISEEDYKKQVAEMNSQLEGVMLELELIRAEATVAVLETARDILFTVIPVGGALKLVFNIIRVAKSGSSRCESSTTDKRCPGRNSMAGRDHNCVRS